jgi:acetyltransferase
VPQLRATRDGRLALLRAVRESDVALLDAFFNGLSQGSRRRRFHGGVRSLTPALLQHMTHPDPRQELALLAITLEAAQAVCIGEARYAVGDGPAAEREFALVVADHWQGAGLGSAMLHSLTGHAQAHGVERLVGDVLADNAAMIRMAQRNGYTVHTHPSDARLLRLTRAVVQTPIDSLPGLAPCGVGMPGWSAGHERLPVRAQ